MTSRIDKEKLFEYCRIPVDELENHPDSKIKIKIYEQSSQTYEAAGNMLADEVVENNKINEPTRWVLPGGPDAMFEHFLKRVHSERISLKNVHIFMMDDYLDFNCRPFPYDNLNSTSNTKAIAFALGIHNGLCLWCEVDCYSCFSILSHSKPIICKYSHLSIVR